MNGRRKWKSYTPQGGRNGGNKSGGDAAEVATCAAEFVIALIRRTVNRSARAAPAARNCAIKIASIKISIMNVY